MKIKKFIQNLFQSFSNSISKLALVKIFNYGHISFNLFLINRFIVASTYLLHLFEYNNILSVLKHIFHKLK